MTDRSNLVITRSTASHALAFRDDFSLLLWGRGIVTEDALFYGGELRARLGTAARAGAIVWLTGLPQSAPEESVRAPLAKIISRAPPGFVGLAYVVEAVGFGSAIARSVITGLSLLAQSTLRVTTHEDPSAALAALAPGLGWSADVTRDVRVGLSRARAAWARDGGTPVPT